MKAWFDLRCAFGKAFFVRTHQAIWLALAGFFLLVSTASTLQAQSCQCARKEGGTSNDAGFGIAVDGAGNTFITGSFQGNATFGAGGPNQTVLTSTGGADIFIAKYSAFGPLEWIKQAGSSSPDEGKSVAVDTSGNVYVTGNFRGTATFATGTSLTTNGLDDIFIAKYNSFGTLQWVKQAGGNGIDGGERIALDSAGNTYLTGRFTNSATFGAGEPNATTLNSSGDFDFFIAKYNSSGLLQWAKRAGSTGADVGHGIALDSTGSNAYVIGEFVGTVTFGQGDPSPVQITAVGATDIFIAKYNSGGVLQWAQSVGSTDNDIGRGVAVDSSNNVYATGFFKLSATFGAGVTLTSDGGADIFLAKYNSNGALQWAKKAGGAADDEGTQVAVDSSGTGYVTGVFAANARFGQGEANDTTINGTNDIFVAKFNSSGLLQWARGAGASGAGTFGDIGYDIDIDSAGLAYVTGFFENTATFGAGQSNATNLVSAGGTDVFFAKFAVAPVVPGRKIDFDADNKSDIGIYREGTWSILRSSDGGNSTPGWGGPTWLPRPGDFDGDRKNDIAVYEPIGSWSIIRSSDSGNATLGWGGPQWAAVNADYDGDGKIDIAVYKLGAWSILKSCDGTNLTPGWGGISWTPIPADYDGDGKADIAVYDNGAWSIVRSSDSVNVTLGWGGTEWDAVPADYDGDGKADIAVYNRNLGAWSIIRSSDAVNVVVAWGGTSWIPVPNDFDGDGKADIAVYNTINGQWSIRRSSDLGTTAVTHGGGVNDIPLK